MSTNPAIAAIKAQALWDAGEQLRRQAAELHPEFARMLAEPGILTDVRQRAMKAVRELDQMSWDEAADQNRLQAKREGVKLVLSYLDEGLRMAEQAGEQS